MSFNSFTLKQVCVLLSPAVHCPISGGQEGRSDRGPLFGSRLGVSFEVRFNCNSLMFDSFTQIISKSHLSSVQVTVLVKPHNRSSVFRSPADKTFISRTSWISTGIIIVQRIFFVSFLEFQFFDTIKSQYFN